MLMLGNNTYSIDLSSSWTNKTVVLESIHSEAPVLIYQALWPDESQNCFYAFDGGLSQAILLEDQPSVPQNQLWQFTPSKNSWSQVFAPPSSNFTQLVRVVSAGYASGGGAGFALGGAQNRGTNSELGHDVDTPGLVIYNMTSQTWSNISSSGYSDSGISISATAHFVPIFGSAGLLSILEGLVANNYLPSTDRIAIFDPSTQRWAFQAVSGPKPPEAAVSCAVGIQGDNNTYEVRRDDYCSLRG